VVKTRPSAIDANGGAHQPCEIADPPMAEAAMGPKGIAVPKAGGILMVHLQWVHIPHVAMWRHSGQFENTRAIQVPSTAVRIRSVFPGMNASAPRDSMFRRTSGLNIEFLPLERQLLP
jgi:hypothetical protein